MRSLRSQRQGSQSQQWPQHGGEGDALLARLGICGNDALTDLSASLNPLGPPVWLGDWLGRSLPLLTHYPDRQQQEAREALARHHGLDTGQVRVTNGGAEAIHLIAQAYHGKRALVIEPTFGEYARACELNGMEVRRLSLVGDDFRLDVDELCQALVTVDVVFLCRPNNPTGTLVSGQAIETLLEHAEAANTLLVVDEAFIEFHGEQASLVDWVRRGAPLILLRSLTKFYCLPGLRLGYLLAQPERVQQISEYQVAWSLNALAAALIPHLLNDQDYAERTLNWVSRERSRVSETLRRLGYVVPEVHANFVLCRPGGVASPARGEAMLHQLVRHGFIARHTHTFAGLDGSWVRLALGLPATNDAWLAALAGDAE
uniref:threonine-phosphate decarboxylase CobD n=1 Tax=Halomonas sp. TaxID=1486246 RepID=UPI00261181FB|nr:threonine-phosphate decarboxylase CobD [Halomonas sp.]